MFISMCISGFPTTFRQIISYIWRLSLCWSESTSLPNEKPPHRRTPAEVDESAPSELMEEFLEKMQDLTLELRRGFFSVSL